MATGSLGQAIDVIIAALEGLDDNSRVTAVRAACEHLKLQGVPILPGAVAAGPAFAVPSTPMAMPIMGTGQSAPAADIRALREEKQPSSAVEMAALVAYYLSDFAPDAERKSEVRLEDVTRYFKQARFPLPSKPKFLLGNARNAGYFDSGSERGTYRLSPVGYNLVAHNLPKGSGPAMKLRPVTTNRKRRTK